MFSILLSILLALAAAETDVAEFSVKGKCVEGRTGGQCKANKITEWNGCNKCAYGYRWAWPNHFCCTENDISKGDMRCKCHCVTVDGDFANCVCKENGRSNGKCDRRKPASEWDSCDNCQYGSRYAWPKHWCCTTKDISQHADCYCKADYNLDPNGQAFALGAASSFTIEDYAVWGLAAVGFGATLFAAKAAFKSKPQQLEHEFQPVP